MGREQSLWLCYLPSSATEALTSVQGSAALAVRAVRGRTSQVGALQWQEIEAAKHWSACLHLAPRASCWGSPGVLCLWGRSG